MSDNDRRQGSPVEILLGEAYGESFTLSAPPNKITTGHKCVTKAESRAAASVGASLTYGELLPEGVTQLLSVVSPLALSAESLSPPAKSLVDLGMGSGKVALQAFLEHGGRGIRSGGGVLDLTTVLGVELAASRFKLGEAALLRLAELHPSQFRLLKHAPGENATLQDIRGGAITAGDCGEGRGEGRPAEGRTIEFRLGNLFEVVCAKELACYEIVIFQTCLPPMTWPQAAELLLHGATHPRCRLVSFHDLRLLWASLPKSMSSQQQQQQQQHNDDDESSEPQCFRGRCPFHPIAHKATRTCAGSTGGGRGESTEAGELPSNPADNGDECETGGSNRGDAASQGAHRFLTSWAPEAGHPFWCYRRCDGKDGTGDMRRLQALPSSSLVPLSVAEVEFQLTAATERQWREDEISSVHGSGDNGDASGEGEDSTVYPQDDSKWGDDDNVRTTKGTTKALFLAAYSSVEAWTEEDPGGVSEKLLSRHSKLTVSAWVRSTKGVTIAGPTATETELSQKQQQQQKQQTQSQRGGSITVLTGDTAEATMPVAIIPARLKAACVKLKVSRVECEEWLAKGGAVRSLAADKQSTRPSDHGCGEKGGGGERGGVVLQGREDEDNGEDSSSGSSSSGSEDDDDDDDDESEGDESSEGEDDDEKDSEEETSSVDHRLEACATALRPLSVRRSRLTLASPRLMDVTRHASRLIILGGGSGAGGYGGRCALAAFLDHVNLRHVLAVFEPKSKNQKSTCSGSGSGSSGGRSAAGSSSRAPTTPASSLSVPPPSSAPSSAARSRRRTGFASFAVGESALYRLASAHPSCFEAVEQASERGLVCVLRDKRFGWNRTLEFRQAPLCSVGGGGGGGASSGSRKEGRRRRQQQQQKSGGSIIACFATTASKERTVAHTAAENEEGVIEGGEGGACKEEKAARFMNPEEEVEYDDAVWWAEQCALSVFAKGCGDAELVACDALLVSLPLPTPTALHAAANFLLRRLKNPRCRVGSLQDLLAFDSPLTQQPRGEETAGNFNQQRQPQPFLRLGRLGEREGVEERTKYDQEKKRADISISNRSRSGGVSVHCFIRNCDFSAKMLGVGTW